MGQEGKRNSLKSYREKVFISRAELARKAGVSAATIGRIEKGEKCRLETKRKIILALGLELSEAGKIFGDDNGIGFNKGGSAMRKIKTEQAPKKGFFDEGNSAN